MSVATRNPLPTMMLSGLLVLPVLLLAYLFVVAYMSMPTSVTAFMAAPGAVAAHMVATLLSMAGSALGAVVWVYLSLKLLLV